MGSSATSRAALGATVAAGALLLVLPAAAAPLKAKPRRKPIPTKPRPLSVRPVLDGSRAVHVTIGVSGGTLVATGANGTRFTLTVPAKALAVDTTITMTPLARIRSLPFSKGLLGGVRLEPEGLAFLVPATLRLTLPHPVSVKQQLAFTTTGAGRDLHLYPQAYARRAVTLKLVHFSDYGAGRGTSADATRLVQHPPSTAEAQSEQDFAAANREARTGEDLPFRNPQRAAGERWLDAYDALVPKLEAALRSDSLDEIAAAAQRALALARWDQLMGRHSSQAKALSDYVRRLIRHAGDVAFQHCAQRHEVAPMIRYLTGVARQLELVGDPAEQTYLEDIEKCDRFELDVQFDASLQGGGSIGEDYLNATGDLSVAVHSLPLVARDSGSAVQGSAPPEVATWVLSGTVSNPEATCDVQQSPATVEAPMHAELAWRGGEHEGEPPAITLDLDQGSIALGVIVGGDCTGQFPNFIFYRQMWESLFPAGVIGVRVADWTYVGGATWATKTAVPAIVSNTYSGIVITWTLNAKLVLRHTPEA